VRAIEVFQSAGSNESDWSEVVREIDDLLDQIVASEDGSLWGGNSPDVVYEISETRSI